MDVIANLYRKRRVDGGVRFFGEGRRRLAANFLESLETEV